VAARVKTVENTQVIVIEVGSNSGSQGQVIVIEVGSNSLESTSSDSDRGG
jgi:hypothetical protein